MYLQYILHFLTIWLHSVSITHSLILKVSMVVEVKLMQLVWNNLVEPIPHQVYKWFEFRVFLLLDWFPYKELSLPYHWPIEKLRIIGYIPFTMLNAKSLIQDFDKGGWIHILWQYMLRCKYLSVYKSGYQQIFICFGLILWHIYHCRSFNAQSIFIQIYWVWFLNPFCR